MKKIILISISIIALVLIYIGSHFTTTSTTSEVNTDTISNAISFPSGNEELVAGETYVLRWKGGQDTIQIFLIDRSLKSKGASISISDRVYGVTNTGSYTYTVPERMNEGEYEFQIGDQTSRPFRITRAQKNGTYCFSYSQDATPTAPYEVKEHIVLDIQDTMVMGTKKGTQNGPDMTNGYYGTLKGTISENILSLVYSYTIEGSSNKELELYTLNSNSIVKSRFPLVEKNGMLVPDKSKNAMMITYVKESCK